MAEVSCMKFCCLTGQVQDDERREHLERDEVNGGSYGLRVRRRRHRRQRFVVASHARPRLLVIIYVATVHVDVCSTRQLLRLVTACETEFGPV